jgi:hypothetical protein
MPRLPKDYSKIVIYKLVCNDLNITDCYVGNTTDFIRRKQKHKNNSTNENDRCYKYKVYETIRNNGGWDNWTMVEIEKYPCKDSYEARAKEREWFDYLNSGLNTIYPQRSPKEYMDKYCKDNKERLLIENRKWRNANLEAIATHNKEIIECECGCSLSRIALSRHRKTPKHISNMSLKTSYLLPVELEI